MKNILMLLALLFLGALPAAAQVNGPISEVKWEQYYIVNLTATSTLSIGEIVKVDSAHASQVIPTTNADTAAPTGIFLSSNIGTTTCAAAAKCEIAIAGIIDGALKTENTCAIGNYVVISNVGGGASGNSMCTASPTGPYLGKALSAASGTAGSPVAIDILVAPGTASSVAPVSKWENLQAQGTQAAAFLSASNQTRVWGFTLDVPVTFSHIVYDVFTADTTSGSLCGAFADCYDVGIYNSSGTLLADCGAAAFSATGAVDCTITQGTVTIQPGAFYLGFTGNSTTGAIQYATSLTFGFASAVSVTGASTGGVLNGSVTPPTDTWNSVGQKSAVFALHN
jgi:hypothetical protein